MLLNAQHFLYLIVQANIVYDPQGTESEIGQVKIASKYDRFLYTKAERKCLSNMTSREEKI